MPGEKNLIIGFWSGLPFGELEPFLASLRNTGFDGDLCILVDNVTAETVRQLVAHGVVVERLGQSAQNRMASQCSRFFAYLDFLARHEDRYRHVMLTDLRNVVFQSDPFAQPFPSDVVFAHERCRLVDSAMNRRWVEQAYGRPVAENMRNCLVSHTGATFGTIGGVLKYLTAMTSELTSRPVAMEEGIEQGVHNYVVHVRPPRGGWLDTGDSIVATMRNIGADSLEVSDRGVLVEGRLVPVVHRWQEQRALADHVKSSPRFRLAPTVYGRGAATQANAVISYYHRERDAGWLDLFHGSLRCTGYAGALHCAGSFDAAELAVLARHGCVAHAVSNPDPSLQAENVAHLFINQVLDRIAETDAAAIEQVLVVESVKAGFQRDPFQNATIGLSAFCEGPVRIGEADYNRERLALFGDPTEHALRQSVVSSALFRGPFDVVRRFYRQLFIEFVGRAERLSFPQGIQGAVNKLCHGGGFDFPIVLYPNASEVFFNYWPTELPIVTRPVVRVGEAVPAMVFGTHIQSDLIAGLQRSLGLLASPSSA